jgi:hypothetical protein
MINVCGKVTPFSRNTHPQLLHFDNATLIYRPAGGKTKTFLGHPRPFAKKNKPPLRAGKLVQTERKRACSNC